MAETRASPGPTQLAGDELRHHRWHMLETWALPAQHSPEAPQHLHFANISGAAGPPLPLHLRWPGSTSTLQGQQSGTRWARPQGRAGDPRSCPAPSQPPDTVPNPSAPPHLS